MSDRLKKFTNYIELFDFYGELLTIHQQNIMNDYYLLNLSLNEISEIRGISRNAVNDALKKAIAKLEVYEEKLGLIKLFQKLKKIEDPKIKQLVIDIESKIKNGI
ncbi:MAG: DNA-binding protein [Bacilli bacterium]